MAKRRRVGIDWSGVWGGAHWPFLIFSLDSMDWKDRELEDRMENSGWGWDTPASGMSLFYVFDGRIEQATAALGSAFETHGRPCITLRGAAVCTTSNG